MIDRELNRRLRYYFRLNYPIDVHFSGTKFVGRYPDLDGVATEGSNPGEVYHRLDALRREWLSERLLQGQPVPLPNSHIVRARRAMDTLPGNQPQRSVALP